MMAVLVVLGALVLGYTLLKANSRWIYRCCDRALRHATDSLPHSYEVPRYFTLTPSGVVDVSRRWPGWDGWYFFVLPDDRGLPFKMVRASLMTGLYGLNGIDTYAKLPRGSSAFDVAEFLLLAPVEQAAAGGVARVNRFTQHYLPKAAALTMQAGELQAAVAAALPGAGELYGKIRGAWPEYHLQFSSPETGIELDLTYRGENLIWWADLPFFTYFAAFGRFAGSITFQGDQGLKEVYALTGRGACEHGFARKPCNFDPFWLPVTWLQKLFPAFRPVRYHYELFLGDGPLQGGFMHVNAFGIAWRDRGGLFVNGSYQEVQNVTVAYLEDPEPDLMPLPAGAPPVKFYRRWHVTADTAAGRLEYVGEREWPPARIASHMMYYNFAFAGTFAGETISGRGYGEYLHI
jgi:hypothetical protein